LVLVTLIWGTTFVVVKVAVETVDPAAFVAARFGLGAASLALLYPRRLGTISAGTLRAGALLGTALLVGYLLQTVGLRLTSPARAGFITGLSVVLVPAIDGLLARAWPSRQMAIGVTLSMAGMATLSAPLSAADLAAGDWRGDLLVFGCAVAFAMHVVWLGRLAGQHDVVPLTIVQIGTVGMLATAVALVTGAALPLRLDTAQSIAYMAVVATALVFLLQTWAQRHTSPTRTALIFALEPVFAALFAIQVYGESLTPRAAGGGTLIVAGMVVAELRAASRIR
jgi:drug/metabolite transporter (DMT)-like permease